MIPIIADTHGGLRPGSNQRGGLAIAFALILAGTILLLAGWGCAAVYTADSPAVQKTDALVEDATEVADLVDAATAVLNDPDAPAAARRQAHGDLAYAALLSRTMGVVADSLRYDLLAIPPEERSSDAESKEPRAPGSRGPSDDADGDRQRGKTPGLRQSPPVPGSPDRPQADHPEKAELGWEVRSCHRRA